MLVWVEEEILIYIKNKIEIVIFKKEIKLCNLEFIVFLLFKMYIVFVYDWEKWYELFLEEKIVELIELYFLCGLF